MNDSGEIDLDSLFSRQETSDTLECATIAEKPGSIKRRLKREIFNKDRKKVMSEIVERLPEPGESFHIITNGKFDFYDVIPRVLELGKMHGAKVSAATWCCNRRCALNLLDLIKTGKIAQMELIVGLYLKRREQAVFSTLANGFIEYGQKLLATECHAKVITIEHEKDRFSIESSANWTSNPRIEQFAIINDRGLHDFHREWIGESFNRSNQQ